MTNENKTQDIEFSIVISCYYEEKSIEEFHQRLKSTLDNTGRSYEIILVNDGSTDGTWEKLKKLYNEDENIYAILNLYRNSGQQAGVTAGIMEARGKAIVLIDSDLQLAPEDLPKLIEKYDEGYDVVSGYRQHRQDSFLRRFPSRIANWIMRKSSGAPLTDFGCTYKIYRADLVRAFEYGPFYIFRTADVISRAGSCIEVPVQHFPRPYGKSGYTFLRLWQYNMDNLVRTSPRLFQWFAVICLFFGFLFFLRIISAFFFDYRIMKEITPGLILNVITFSLLIIIGILSIIGEFAIRSFLALYRIPAFIVKEKWKRVREN
ncbi:MAG TPA: glycosyltransferase family 2 protein [Candidatus Hydrogenedens sp.]|nr:glycosyltransferase family 2 protein [Candidatus Hydrogenedens sp.]HOL18843.1 glycosyltransferase family 2 protein [Candidatus Hydrogenedens sp.]